MNLKNLKKLLPQRPASSNKAQAGHSLIIAGSSGMWGAALLAAAAAARVGSGYVSVMTDLKKFPLNKHPDFLTLPLNAPVPFHKLKAIAIGPGMGQKPITLKKLKTLSQAKFANVVVDADALNVAAKQKRNYFLPTWILTPHEGELARLLNVSSQKIKSNRKKYVRIAAQKFGCIVLLKGHKTLICYRTKILEISTGNAALAKAGTGDVLTGMITGFLAQGVLPLNAAYLAATIHGFIADEWLKEKNDILSLMASDLIERLPKVLFKLRKN